MLNKEIITKIGEIVYNDDFKGVDALLEANILPKNEFLNVPPLIVLFDSEKSKKTPLNVAVKKAWSKYLKIRKVRK